MVEVRLFATLRENRGKILHINIEDNYTGQQLCDHLDIKADDVAIFLINGWHSKLDDTINNDDVVAIFPPVGGG